MSKLNKLMILSAVIFASACATPGNQNSSKNTAAPERDRVDEAFNDGRCSSEEARNGTSSDCQQQNARSREQRDVLGNTRDSLNDLSIDELGLDRSLPSTGNQGLLR